MNQGWAQSALTGHNVDVRKARLLEIEAEIARGPRGFDTTALRNERKRINKAIDRALSPPAAQVLPGKKKWHESKDRQFVQSANSIDQIRRSYEPKPYVKREWVPDQYAEYLTSREWFLKRDKLFKKRGRACEGCGSKQQITVHHLSYARLGREPLRDLVILCWPCHQQRHPVNLKAESPVTAKVKPAGRASLA